MTKRRDNKTRGRGDYDIVVRSVRQEHPDPKKIARVILRLAFAEAEAEAAAKAEHEAKQTKQAKPELAAHAASTTTTKDSVNTEGLCDAE